MTTNIQRVTGTADLAPHQWRRLATIQAQLQEFLAQRGYQMVSTPTLEQTELFLRKSGGELAAKMYSFTDPGGRRVSLRPEFTSSVVRAYVEGSLTGPLPQRWQYSGTVFRYEPDETGRREFPQLGGELVGAAGVAADAEVVALAAQGLGHVGVRRRRLRVGHLGVVNTMLDSLGLSERARVFILAHLGELRQGPEGLDRVRQRATELGLLRPRGTHELGQLAQRLGTQEALEMVEGFMAEAVTGPTGQRTSEEVLVRYLRKLRQQEDPSRVERALEFAVALSTLPQAPRAALRELRALLRSSRLSRALLQPLQSFLQALGSYDLRGTTVRLDLGMARGIAYYTGVVFEIDYPGPAEGLSLGGGGRYDGLVKALGGRRDIPALGFAYSLDRVSSALPARWGGGASNDVVQALVVPLDGGMAAPAVAERLRNQGTTAELEVAGRGEEHAVAYARRRGIKSVVLVNPDGSTRERTT